MMLRSLLRGPVAVALAGLMAVVGLRAAPAHVRDHVIEVDDCFTLASVRELATAPDGSAVAYIDRRWEADAERANADLWVVERATHQARRLTFDSANESDPQWSPDGRFVYVSAAYKRPGEEKPPYDGKTQVWRIATDGSASPQPVTQVKGGIVEFHLSRDGNAVFYSVEVEKTDDAWKALRQKHDKVDYGHGVTKFTAIHRLDLATWRSEKLVDEGRVVRAFAVSPDGRRIAMHTTPDEELIHNEGWSRMDVYDADTGNVTVVTADGWRDGHPSPFGWINTPAWSADSRALAFTVAFDGYTTQVYAAEVVAEGAARLWRVEVPEPFMPDDAVAWRGAERTLAIMVDDRARGRVVQIEDVRAGDQGRAAVVTPGNVSVIALSFSRAGQVAAVIASTPDTYPDVHLIGTDGALEPITHVNPQMDTWQLPTRSIVKWKAPDGTEVEGVLELPAGYRPGDGPLPTLVWLHGGPTSATRFAPISMMWGSLLMPARGYAWFSPNYRGSTGYGNKFLTALIGHENDIEVADILAGVDALVERGVADPERLAVMGWSNGGFLTNCVITRTPRFKAASSGAGVVSQVLQWGLEDTPGHVINYMGGTFPWNGGDHYRAASPLDHLESVTTPTLIHVGANDERVPAAHARALYRGLHFYLKVPCELVVYPGEGHGLSKLEHWRTKMEWDFAWFDRYVMGKVDTKEAP